MLKTWRSAPRGVYPIAIRHSMKPIDATFWADAAMAG